MIMYLQKYNWKIGFNMSLCFFLEIKEERREKNPRNRQEGDAGNLLIIVWFHNESLLSMLNIYFFSIYFENKFFKHINTCHI